MWEEVVPDEDRDEDEVVDDGLEVVRERELGGEGGELQVEVFSEEGKVHEVKVLGVESGKARYERGKSAKVEGD
jgi:hypothetical protein